MLWQGSRHLTPADLRAAPELRPIRVRTGYYGNRRDLIVSPQHGIVVQGPQGAALIRARHLAETGLGARVAQGMRQVTYQHLLLPAHGLILAEGAVAESHYPGPLALRAPARRDRLTLTRAIRSRPGMSSDATASLEQQYGARCLPLLSRQAAAAWLLQAGFAVKMVAC